MGFDVIGEVTLHMPQITTRDGHKLVVSVDRHKRVVDCAGTGVYGFTLSVGNK